MNQWFILAAGKQARFRMNRPKQLLPVGEETILERQQRQAHDHGREPYVVTTDDAIKDASCQWLHPEKYDSVLDTIISTRGHWRKLNVFLLGDVYFSDAVFDDIAATRQTLRFWMSGSEIFAFAFLKTIAGRIIAAAKHCTSQVPDARLWHLYRSLEGLDIHAHVVHWNQVTGEMIGDETQDIDSYEQYLDLCRKLNCKPL